MSLKLSTVGDTEEIRKAWPASCGAWCLLWIGVYFVLQVVTRIFLSENLQLDEAEQMVLAQNWGLGFGSQPPLYTWLQKGFFHFFGINILSLSLLKNLCLWSIYAFVFLSAREIFKDKHLAALCAVSLFFLPQLAWESQRDQAHLILATALSASTLFTLLKTITTRKSKWYVLFGISAAMGVLAKYNFAIFIVALILVALITKPFNAALMDRKILFSLLVFGVLVMPHGIWLLQHLSLATSQSYKFKIDDGNGEFLVYLKIILRMAKVVFIFLITPTLIFALLFSRTPANLFALNTERRGAALLKFLFFTAVWALAIGAVLCLAFRVTYIRERWLQPILFLLPILFVGFAQAGITRSVSKRIFCIAGLMAIVVLIVINSMARFANVIQRAHNLNLPYAALAAELRKEGFADGTIVANGWFLGGNLKTRFKKSQVIVPQQGGSLIAQRPTAIVWIASGTDLPTDFLTFASRVAQVPQQDLRPRFIEVPCINGPRRSERWGVILLTSDKNTLPELTR